MQGCDAGEDSMSTRQADVTRSVTVDLAKGLAIMLVVVGHYDLAEAPDWWRSLHELIYTFHMPVFFVMAGYTWHVRPQERYFGYLARKAQRLLLPCLSIAVLYLGMKLAASILIDLKHPLDRMAVINVVIDPVHSVVPFVWFLYALFAVYAIFPLLHRLGPWVLWTVVAVVVVLFSRHSHYWLAGISIGLYYFALGMFLARGLHIRLDEHIPRRVAGLAILCFVPLVALFPWQTDSRWAAQIRQLLLGGLGVTATILTCQAIVQHRRRRHGDRPSRLDILAYIGASSMTIYIFHVLFEGAAYNALHRLHPSRDLPFVLKALPSIAAGISLPLFLQWLVIRRSAVLRTLFLGESSKPRRQRTGQVALTTARP
jgi:fucose 4-O-acetylase-like acetyltransferase